MTNGVKTIQEIIDRGETIRAHCFNWQCHHSAVLDMLALRDKFRPKAAFMHDNVVPWLRCSKCGGDKCGIICTPGDVKQYGGNPYLKAKGG